MAGLGHTRDRGEHDERAWIELDWLTNRPGRRVNGKVFFEDSVELLNRADVKQVELHEQDVLIAASGLLEQHPQISQRLVRLLGKRRKHFSALGGPPDHACGIEHSVRGDRGLRYRVVHGCRGCCLDNSLHGVVVGVGQDSWGLTFDMSGGRRQARPAGGRPLDGGVRPHRDDQHGRAIRSEEARKSRHPSPRLSSPTAGAGALPS